MMVASDRRGSSRWADPMVDRLRLALGKRLKLRWAGPLSELLCQVYPEPPGLLDVMHVAAADSALAAWCALCTLGVLPLRVARAAEPDSDGETVVASLELVSTPGCGEESALARAMLADHGAGLARQRQAVIETDKAEPADDQEGEAEIDKAEAGRVRRCNAVGETQRHGADRRRHRLRAPRLC